MEYCKTLWFCIYVLVLAVHTWNGCEAQLKDVTACYGTAKCNLFTMSCDKESDIRVLQMMYGLKNYSCNSATTKCLRNRNGCCVFKKDDCFEAYTPLHAYNLYRECSMQRKCGPLQAPNNILNSCNKKSSTYIYLEYECIPFTDKIRTIGFCEDRVIYPDKKKSSIRFTAETNTFRGNTCSCRITGLLDITTTFEDIRMFKHKSGTGSTCSSASLSNNQDNQPEIICNSSVEEQNNFVYYDSFKSNDVKITLKDLNKDGEEDIPSVVWILVEGALQIECSTSDVPEMTTQPSTFTPQSNGTLGTKTEEQNESDSSSVGIIAGVVAGLLVVVVVVVGIVVFIFFKRRNKGPKRKMARQNSYTAASSVRSTANSIYDEINDNEQNNIYDPVYESKKQEPLYDPVYEPKLSNSATASSPNSLAKTDTYVGKGGQDTASSGNENEGRYVILKKIKAPFSKVKKQTSKFVDFVKSRTGQEPTTPKQRPRDASGGSYDHLRVGAKTAEVNPLKDEPSHAYAHAAAVKKTTVNQPNNLRTTALQAKDIEVVGLQTKTSEIIGVTLNKKEAIRMKPEGKKGLKSSKDTIEKVPSDTDLQAVHVGDDYIEFQSNVDENNPNIVKMKEPDLSANHLRPTPPTRDPPSPKLSRPPSPLPKSSNSPSPITETAQKPTSPTWDDLATKDTGPSYDYADPNRLSPRLGKRSPTGRESPHQDNYEVDVLDEHPSYDYADVSDGEDYVNLGKTDSIYEDVGRRLREASMKKHISEADINNGLIGYEVPVTSSSRPTSSPNKTSNTSHYENLNNNNRIPLKPPTATKPKQNAHAMDSNC